MSTSLYDLSVGTYLQIVESAANVLQKGADHFAEQGRDVNSVVDMRLTDDMANFHFQVVCVGHHSLKTVEAIQSGEFGPPSGYPDMDYAGLQGFLADALVALRDVDAGAIDAKSGSKIIFKIGGNEIPFTTENFVLSFSLPNLYFHATTAYDILRREGVALGKMDFLGQMKIG